MSRPASRTKWSTAASASRSACGEPVRPSRLLACVPLDQVLAFLLPVLRRDLDGVAAVQPGDQLALELVLHRALLRLVDQAAHVLAGRGAARARGLRFDELSQWSRQGDV